MTLLHTSMPLHIWIGMAADPVHNSSGFKTLEKSSASIHGEF